MTSRTRIPLLVTATAALAVAWFVEGGEVLWLASGLLIALWALVAPGRAAAYGAVVLLSVSLGFTVGYELNEDLGQPAVVYGLLGAVAGLGVSVGVLFAVQRAARASADATR